jgi:NADH-quinone oxidoreductase subunit L
MTGVLVVLAVLSAVGGFLSIPHFLEPQLPLPQVVEGMDRFHYVVVGLSIAIAAAGVVGAWWFFTGTAERAERVRRQWPALNRLLSAKYFVDEAYEALIHKKLLWVSDKVFLGIGDRRLFDGALHGLVALGLGTSRVLGRIQTGSLHLYAFLVLAGIVVTLLWALRHV